MKRFNIKEFAEWHKRNYGAGIFPGDIEEYYSAELGRDYLFPYDCSENKRFQSIVSRTMKLNNY